MTEVPTGRADRDLWWSIGRTILAPVMAALFRIRVHGLENLPTEGGAILAANHVSVFDAIVHGLVASRRTSPEDVDALTARLSEALHAQVARARRIAPLR